MLKLTLIALGGACGALARYGISGFVQQRMDSAFPFGTLAVNVIGCFVLGGLMALVQDHPLLRPEARSFIAIGILGAFTTFSTFGYETSALIHDNQWNQALLNILANIVIGLAAVELGRLLVRSLGV
ncbi:MAG: fluoride efflux transporter CrcB [Candidatus Hydrogenedentes bacterium]|nr:fluoride efflux transporter CrcB [Candidatus Hydrogenedentota bacterium]